MKLFKCLRAYYTGMVTCSCTDRKVLPSHIYNYNKSEMKWFIKGLLKNTKQVNKVKYYIHPSMIYLVNIEKILKDNGIKTKIICNDYIKCVEIAN